MAEVINDDAPATQRDARRDLDATRSSRAPALRAAEAGASRLGQRRVVPDGGPLTALRAALPVWFPRVNEIIRLIGSHNLLAAPTAAQLADPTLRPLIDRYLRGAKDVTAEERVRVFRLAWDFVGSALGEPQRAVRALLPGVGRAQLPDGAHHARRRARGRQAGRPLPRRRLQPMSTAAIVAGVEVSTDHWIGGRRVASIVDASRSARRSTARTSPTSSAGGASEVDAAVARRAPGLPGVGRARARKAGADPAALRGGHPCRARRSSPPSRPLDNGSLLLGNLQRVVPRARSTSSSSPTGR